MQAEAAVRPAIGSFSKIISLIAGEEEVRKRGREEKEAGSLPFRQFTKSLLLDRMYS
jgi:hypothetical protein